MTVQHNGIRCNSGMTHFGFLSSESCRRVTPAIVLAVVGNPNTVGMDVAGNMLLSVANSARTASAAGWDATQFGCGGLGVRCTSGTWIHSARLGKLCGLPEASTVNSGRAMLIVQWPFPRASISNPMQGRSANAPLHSQYTVRSLYLWGLLVYASYKYLARCPTGMQ